jgi:glucosamine--fructose-6-phosphate aminotransferase (isomerizing)
MCGIFSIISSDKNQNITQRLLNGLKLLEYRGYDSAGMALLSYSNQYQLFEENNNYEVNVVKAIGEISNLQAAYDEVPISGYAGIAHTRWATHGSVSIKNTHPLIVGDIAIVHNGTVENYFELRQFLHEKYGYIAFSDTDTEVIAALIHYALREFNDLLEAIRWIAGRLIGKLSFVCMSQYNPELLICASFGRQLVIGMSDGMYFISSDIIAFPHEVHSTIYMENGDIGVVGWQTLKVYNLKGQITERKPEQYSHQEYKLTYNEYKTFMYKEICEQPQLIKAIIDCIKSDLDRTTQNSAILAAMRKINFINYKRIHIIGCGAAYYAGYIGKYLIERECHILANIDIASEFCMRQPVIDSETLYIFISQSGETADTISALDFVKARGAATLAIVNRMQSPIAKRCDIVIPIEAGIEQSVAATKTFTTQILIFQLLSRYFKGEQFLIESLKNCDAGGLRFNEQFEDEIINAVREISSANRLLYIGRDIFYPICLEGALKIKEIGYIAAEGIAAGEIKHGPIALVDEYTPVIILAPYAQGEIFTKLMSNIQEINARQGKIILITCKKGKQILSQIGIKTIIVIPDIHEILMPIAYSIPLQLIAYHYALNMGYNIDKPRNLAKSVTVE